MTGDKMKQKRRDAQKKKQIFFLGLIVLAVAATVAGLVINGLKERSYPESYENADSKDTITYDGKEYEYNDHLTNYLFMGIDTREPVETYETQSDAGQADAIFLLSLDRVTQQIFCLMIPRDTMTQIEVFGPDGKSFGKSEDHINLQYAFGDGKTKSCELMEEAVSKLLYQIPIRQYCSLNMDAIPILTDLAGGIELVVPDDSLQDVNPEFQQGAVVTITGENAEQFVRYRDIGKTQSAIVRMNRQKVFLEAYLKKVQELSQSDTSMVTKLYEGVQDYMVTNMGTDHFVKLLEASQSGEITVETLPGEGTQGEYYDEYHVDDDQLYDMIIRMFYHELEQ